MSSTRVVPDENGWIDTSRNASRKKPAQRPLVSHGSVGTRAPPYTTGKIKATPSSSTTAAKRRPRLSLGTPTAPRGGGIEKYFALSGSGTAQAGALRQRDLNARSTEADRTPDLRERVDVAAWKAARTVDQPLLISSSLRPATSRNLAPTQATPPTPSMPLSPRDLTQVPPHIFERHKRLCGQDNATRERARSPWRLGEDDSPDEEEARAARDQVRKAKEVEQAAQRERKRLRLDVREAVELDAAERIRRNKDRRGLGEFKSLAHLSSDCSMPSGSSSPSHRSSPSAKHERALRRHSSAVQAPVCPRDDEWPRRQPKPRAVSSAGRHKSSHAPADDTPKAKQVLQRRPGVSPGTTPTHSKPRSRKHQQVTPPKLRPPSTPQSRRVEHPETLFVWPPPKQPDFQAVVAEQSAVAEWQPVTMEPETLMTWSLGPSDPTAKAVDAPASEVDEITSIAASTPSKSFPRFFDSPTQDQNFVPRKRAVRQSPHHGDDPTESESVIECLGDGKAPRSPSPSPMPKRRVKWAPKPTPTETLPEITIIGSSSPVVATKSDCMPPPAGRRRTTKPNTGSQTRLAAHGYFRQTLRTAKGFDTSFSDEEELDFEVDDEPSAPPTSRPGAPPSSRGRHIPGPPPHPSLLPAGRRMFVQREEDAMERHRAQHPNNSSSLASPPPASSMIDFSDHSSSLVGAEVRLEESAKEWWDRLGDATVDEFPSL